MHQFGVEFGGAIALEHHLLTGVSGATSAMLNNIPGVGHNLGDIYAMTKAGTDMIVQTASINFLAAKTVAEVNKLADKIKSPLRAGQIAADVNHGRMDGEKMSANFQETVADFVAEHQAEIATAATLATLTAAVMVSKNIGLASKLGLNAGKTLGAMEKALLPAGVGAAGLGAMFISAKEAEAGTAAEEPLTVAAEKSNITPTVRTEKAAGVTFESSADIKAPETPSSVKVEPVVEKAPVERGLKHNFELTLGKGTVPGQMERVFHMMAVDAMTDALGDDNMFGKVEASISLNVAANLVKLAQGGGIREAGISVEQAHVAFEVAGDKIIIKDYSKFNELVKQLHTHAGKLWERGVLQTGAQKYIGDIKTDTWEKIIKAEGLEKDVEGHDEITKEQIEKFARETHSEKAIGEKHKGGGEKASERETGQGEAPGAPVDRSNPDVGQFPDDGIFESHLNFSRYGWEMGLNATASGDQLGELKSEWDKVAGQIKGLEASYGKKASADIEADMKRIFTWRLGPIGGTQFYEWEGSPENGMPGLRDRAISPELARALKQPSAYSYKVFGSGFGKANRDGIEEDRWIYYPESFLNERTVDQAEINNRRELFKYMTDLQKTCSDKGVNSDFVSPQKGESIGQYLVRLKSEALRVGDYQRQELETKRKELEQGIDLELSLIEDQAEIKKTSAEEQAKKPVNIEVKTRETEEEALKPIGPKPTEQKETEKKSEPPKDHAAEKAFQLTGDAQKDIVDYRASHRELIGSIIRGEAKVDQMEELLSDLSEIYLTAHPGKDLPASLASAVGLVYNIKTGKELRLNRIFKAIANDDFTGLEERSRKSVDTEKWSENLLIDAKGRVKAESVVSAIKSRQMTPERFVKFMYERFNNKDLENTTGGAANLRVVAEVLLDDDPENDNEAISLIETVINTTPRK
jgi:hypothetical protein